VTTVHATNAGSESLSEMVGERIRHMRHSRKMTLVELAEQCELSHPFLSQLERGLARPSIASLERIARALGTSQIELLSAVPTPSDAPTVSLIRQDSGATGPYSPGRARLLVDSSRPFHPMEVESDTAEFADPIVHDEDEWAYVMVGTIEMDLDGELSTLGPGDSVYYAGGTAHRWRSVDGRTCRLLVVKERPQQS
jgi:transcriptional regulator with XRE-family HTH domain